MDYEVTGFESISIWSLIIPAMDQSKRMGKLSFVPACAGFWIGILFLLLLDSVIPHLHMNAEKAEGPKAKLKKTTMMVLAVTLHNIPEGMAVGVVYAGLRAGNSTITSGGALALALGIAIQNFPEGAIISMPLHAEGHSKARAFLDGVLSGAVEPIGGLMVNKTLFLNGICYFDKAAISCIYYHPCDRIISYVFNLRCPDRNQSIFVTAILRWGRVVHKAGISY